MASHVAHISQSELAKLDISGTPTISDTKHLASYSWIEASTPTIAVPGLPPLWSPPQGAQKVNKDSGHVFIAQNAARHPASPIEPLFRSLFLAHPEFDGRSVDVITDRNNIRKLLDFIQPGRDRRREEAFSINVEIVGKTMIFGRTETKVMDFIKPHEFRGYGHEFEKRYTESQIPDATGHHQIPSYSFCGMNFIVRYEADGYVDPSPSQSNATKKADGTTEERNSNNQGHGTKENSGTSEENKTERKNSRKGGESSEAAEELKQSDLSDLLDKLTLKPMAEELYMTRAGSALRVRTEGHEVPLISILEIKTRNTKKRIGFSEVAPQLWVSQTPNLVRAYHEDGRFSEPTVENVSQKLQDWEKAREVELRQLGALIQWLGKTVKGLRGKATIRYGGRKGDLTVHRNFGLAAMLPSDLYSKWKVVREQVGPSEGNTSILATAEVTDPTNI